MVGTDTWWPYILSASDSVQYHAPVQGFPTVSLISLEPRRRKTRQATALPRAHIVVCCSFRPSDIHIQSMVPETTVLDSDFEAACCSYLGTIGPGFQLKMAATTRSLSPSWHFQLPKLPGQGIVLWWWLWTHIFLFL
jgi:hypothetical protein